jgi:hypothetical protein
MKLMADSADPAMKEEKEALHLDKESNTNPLSPFIEL